MQNTLRVPLGMLLYTLRTLALRLALWDVGCNIARYILCRVLSAYGIMSCNIISYSILSYPTTPRHSTPLRSAALRSIEIHSTYRILRLRRHAPRAWPRRRHVRTRGAAVTDQEHAEVLEYASSLGLPSGFFRSQGLPWDISLCTYIM